jgi:hypothetical protein
MDNLPIYEDILRVSLPAVSHVFGIIDSNENPKN